MPKHPVSHGRLIRAACLVAVMAGPTDDLLAQRSVDSLVVAVVAPQAARVAVAQAVVSLRPLFDGPLVRTDTTRGASPVMFRQVPPGRYRIEVAASGFAASSVEVTVDTELAPTVRIELVSPTQLPSLESRMNPVYRGRLADFERRRATGKGTFLTRADLQKGQSRLIDALKSVRGLRIDCRGACYVRMIRSTACEPRIFLDGFPTDVQALYTPILDIGGVEIYHGPSETPGEFLGSNSMCGVIVVWTSATGHG